MHVIVPCPALRPFIGRLWASDSAGLLAGTREHVLPTGRMHMVFRFSDEPRRVYDGAGDTVGSRIAGPVAAGARVERPVQDEFYGERGGVVRDPFGHRWNIGHSIEKMSTEEMQRRYTALMQQGE